MEMYLFGALSVMRCDVLVVFFFFVIEHHFAACFMCILTTDRLYRGDLFCYFYSAFVQSCIYIYKCIHMLAYSMN